MNAIDLHPHTWQRLQDWRAKLPHALLLCGQRGLGKVELATHFAGALLCEQPRQDGRACGQCAACHWFEQGNHPDFRTLQPEAQQQGEEGEAAGDEKRKRGGQQITIDQVRQLDDFFAVGTHRHGLRIILLHPAEQLNRNAANSLLKVLEEPPPGTLFLLVSHEQMRLLPTLRSRCQALPVPLPPEAQAIAFLHAAGVEAAPGWLALAGGAPGQALRLAEQSGAVWRGVLLQALESGQRLEVLNSAEELEKLLKAEKGENPLPLLVDGTQKWLVDLNLAAQGLPIRFYLPQRAKINTLARASTPVRLIRFYGQLLRWRRDSEHPLNLRLFLEQLFFSYRALFVE